jgi:serine/threonine protein phosphatase PrpC
MVGTKVFCANAGDTRAVLYRSKKTGVTALSEDHKPSMPSELERIEGVGGHVKAKTKQQKSWFLGKSKTVQRGPERCYPGGLAVARSFGDIRSKIEEFGGLSGVVIASPDVTCTELADDTKMIVIGSDGLWDNVSDYNTLYHDLNKAFRISHQKLSVASAGDAQSEGARRNDFCASTMAHAAVRHSLDEINHHSADNTTALVVLFPEAFNKKYPNLDRGLTRGSSMSSMVSGTFAVEELVVSARLPSIKGRHDSDSEDESVEIIEEEETLLGLL